MHTTYTNQAKEEAERKRVEAEKEAKRAAEKKEKAIAEEAKRLAAKSKADRFLNRAVGAK